MAWPQAPQPAPAPPTAGSSLPVGPIVTAAGAFLTFLASFVRIYKVEAGGEDVGWSVWTTDFTPGLFGVGTLIPFFALVAGAIALARAFAKGIDTKQLGGFTALQLQVVAAAFAVILWFGFLVSIVLADGGFAADIAPGLGMLLLFITLAAVVAGTVLSVLGTRQGTGAASGPPPAQWGAPAGPAPHSAPPAGGQWPAPTPPPPPQPAPQQQWPQPQPPPGQWQQPAAPAWDPNAPAAPGQWQPGPGGAPAQQPWTPSPGGPEQAWQPPAPGAPEQQPPSPAPPAGGGLFDPGTEVIPGPPPAPPAADPGHVGGGPDALPPIPPSNTP